MTKNPFRYIEDINYEDPFSELARGSNSERGVRSSQNINKFELAIGKGMHDFVGRWLLSAALQWPSTAVGKVAAVKPLFAKREENMPFWQGINNFAQMSGSYQNRQAMATLDHRTKTVLFASTLCSTLGVLSGASSEAVAVANAALWGGMATHISRESVIIFNAANAKRFRNLDDVSLVQARTYEDFKSYYDGKEKLDHNVKQFEKYKHKLDKTMPGKVATWEGFVRNEYDVLQKRVATHKANWPHQAIMSVSQKLITSSAIFIADPMAEKVVEKYGNQIESDLGISKDKAKEAISLSFRVACAWSSTVFYGAFCHMSYGMDSPDKVYEYLGNNIKSGGVDKLFSGAFARTTLSLMAMSTIIKGPELADWLIAKVPGIFSEEEIKSESYKKPLQAFGVSSKDLDKIRQINQESEKSCNQMKVDLLKEIKDTPSNVTSQSSASKINDNNLDSKKSGR